MVDVFTVGGENGASADQAAENGERRLQDRQPEGNHRDGDGYDGWRLLGSGESKGAEEKSDEQAAGIS